MKIARIPDNFKQPNFVQDKHEGGGFSGGAYEPLPDSEEETKKTEGKEEDPAALKRGARPGLRVILGGVDAAESMLTNYSGEEFMKMREILDDQPKPGSRR